MYFLIYSKVGATAKEAAADRAAAEKTAAEGAAAEAAAIEGTDAEAAAAEGLSAEEASGRDADKDEGVCIYVMTDPHYLSSELTDGGASFLKTVQNGDSKLPQYSDLYMTAFTDAVLDAEPDLVILSGDLTYNGERLSHEASHDALTGLFNRGAYDMLMESVDTSHIALLVVDIDFFKSINDTYGHAVGDRVLKRVAEVLQASFRSVDIICRFGGDEFVVVMTRVNSSMGQLVVNKVKRANEILSNPKDDLPPVTLSVGVAFSDRSKPQGDIFSDADTALYRVKQNGRGNCAIY